MGQLPKFSTENEDPRYVSIKIPSLILGLIQTAYYLYALYVVSLLDGYDMDHVLPDISSLGPSMSLLNNFNHQIYRYFWDLPVFFMILAAFVCFFKNYNSS